MEVLPFGKLIWVCLKMLCTPLYPMVLLIIIPMKNGYFIGNIPYFQTNPFGKQALLGDLNLSSVVFDVFFCGFSNDSNDSIVMFFCGV